MDETRDEAEVAFEGIVAENLHPSEDARRCGVFPIGAGS